MRTRYMSIEEADVEPERTPVRRCALTPRRLPLFPYPEEKEVPLLPGIQEPRIIYTPQKSIKYGAIRLPIRDVDRRQPRLRSVPGGWGEVDFAGL